MKKTLQTLWITLFLVFLAPAGAQENSDDARIAELLQQGTPGPQTIELGQQARLQLPAGMIYLSQIPANEFMNLIGNTMSTRRYGIVLPADSNEAWIIDLEYTQSGYIREDEANRLNPAQLLQTSAKVRKRKTRRAASAVNRCWQSSAGWQNHTTMRPATASISPWTSVRAEKRVSPITPH